MKAVINAFRSMPLQIAAYYINASFNSLSASEDTGQSSQQGLIGSDESPAA